jgi:uncharacterized protein (TIGR02246 family)
MTKSLWLAAFLWSLVSNASAIAQDAGALFDRWRDAFVAGDIQATLALYPQDATFVGLRSREIGRDRDAAKAYFSGVFEATSSRTLACDPPVVRQRGDVAVIAGVCQFDIAFKNGQKLVGPVRYHMVAQRTGGTWLITDHHLSLVPAQ